MPSRRVNKPRLSLRKYHGRPLAGRYRGVVPMFIKFNIDFDDAASPEQLLTTIGEHLKMDSYKNLSKAQIKRLRKYLISHGIEDYTRDADEQTEYSVAAESSRIKKNSRG